jgi:integrase
MAGAVREAKIQTVTSRARLSCGRKCHWRTIITGRAHLGYQRWPKDREGRWILRTYSGAKYRIQPLGSADDAEAADGERVLNFDQAHANAIARLNAPKGKITRMTVKQAVQAYTDFKRSQGQPTGDLQSRATAHILPALGDVEVAELTSDQIRKWLLDLAASRAMTRTKKNKPQQYKPEPAGDDEVRKRRSSANRVLTWLKAALNHCYDEGNVPTNEAWGRRVKPFRDVEVARVRYLTVAEAKRLINGCDKEFRPLVLGALLTGARYGELTRLQVADFNLRAGTITIRKSKTGKARHVVLTEEGTAFFRQVTTGRAGDQLIFRRNDGTAWRASHQGRPMADAVTRAKIKPIIGFHGLRHSWASLSVMNGVPLMVVAKNLGHVDTRMVEKHYGHMAPSYIVDAIRAGAPKFGFKRDRKIVSLERAKQ